MRRSLLSVFLELQEPQFFVLMAEMQIAAPEKVRVLDGTSAPTAPAGFVYVMQDEIPPLAWVMCICFFPLGLICLLAMKERYWVLQPAGT